MLIRIVKLTFKDDKTEEFLANFAADKDKIRSFVGCEHLELLKELDNPNVFFTYSYWKDEESLENYRHSELFKEVWSRTKLMFSDKPQAWSLNKCSYDF